MAGLKVFDGSSWRAVGIEDSYWDVLSATGGFDNVLLSWPNAGNSPSSYEVEIDGSVIDVGNVTSYDASSLNIGQIYRFKVRPKYSDGSVGGWSFFKDRSPAGPNVATGGLITDISNYNGTGQTWRVHKFTSNGTFSVSQATSDFKVLVVGGGAGGGGGTGGNGGERSGGAGGGGHAILNESQSLSVRSYSVTIGSGGGGGSWGESSGGNGGNGGATTLQDVVTANGGSRGGGGYSGNNGYGGASGNGNSGSPINNTGRGGGTTGNYTISPNGLTSDITGTSVEYGGASSAGRAKPAQVGAANTGMSGSGGGSYTNGAAGGSGVVIVAYRIA